MDTLIPLVPAAAPADGSAAGRFRRLEVRRERCSRRLLLFALLLGLVVALMATLAVMGSFAASSFVALGALAGGHYGLIAVSGTLGLAVLAAGSYWFLAQLDACRRLLTAMHGQPPDPTDRYHQRLLDIVDELRLATGQSRVRCVVVPSLGLNAFAFSDLHGGGVVGVTEGALSRLSRAQLEAVLAHEFANIVSGTHVTATLACLLFGIFADDEKVVYGAEVEAPGYDGRAAAGLLAAGLAAIMRLGAAVVNGAISREREFEADLAAARYTRDPLSLAQALRAVGLSPTGGGYVPPGLAPLCIRADAGDGGGWLARQVSAHPPLDARITALLAMANVSPAVFEAQARQLERAAAGAQHLQRPPASAAPETATHTGAAGACPACGAALLPVDYEGVTVRVCRACGGRWLRAADVARVLARREVGFNDTQRRLAEQVSARGQELRQAAARGRLHPSDPPRPCPGCGTAMVRRMYSYDFTIEIDYCAYCDGYWFDGDELEALQVLAEERIV